jgi:DNA-binding LytR/AlgR family response regulator
VTLDVLVVDDEVPARTDLAWLLEQESDIGSVAVAGDANEALRILQVADIDVVFLDVRMPGLHGLELARVLGRFAHPPMVVFVTAYEEHAVEAFELRAHDYLLKPVRVERLRAALERVRPDATARAGPYPGSSIAAGDGPDVAGEPHHHVVDGPEAAGTGPAVAATRPGEPAVLAVEIAGRTRFVARGDVRYAEAAGDYTRLHCADGRHLVRIPLSRLEAGWAAAGFFRVHRSYLVALGAVHELRASSGGIVVVVDDQELPVSRRQAHGLKDALIRARLDGRS